MVLKDRLESIRSIVKQQTRVQVSELSQAFGVTEETIRRDLEKLEAEGLVNRTYGGAVLNESKLSEAIQYFKRSTINAAAKRLIAKKAFSRIQNCLTIGIDSSTTAFELMRLVKDQEGMTVITNSAIAMTEFVQSKINVLSTGGLFNRHSLSLQGSVARQIIQNYNIDVAVISCKGLSMDKGATDTDETESKVKKELIAHANSTILLADHTKFDKVALVNVAGLEQLDLIVTDREPGDEWKKKLAELSLEVLY